MNMKLVVDSYGIWFCPQSVLASTHNIGSMHGDSNLSNYWLLYSTQYFENDIDIFPKVLWNGVRYCDALITAVTFSVL